MSIFKSMAAAALVVGTSAVTFADPNPCANIQTELNKVTKSIQHVSEKVSMAYSTDAKNFRDYYTKISPYAGRACVTLPADSFESLKQSADVDDKNAKDVMDYNAVLQARLTKIMALVQKCVK